MHCLKQLPSLRLLFSAAVIGCGGFVLGSVLIFPSLAFNKMNTEPNPFRLNLDEYSWAASICSFGGLAGGLCGHYLLDKLGRRSSLVFTAPIFAIGWLFILCAQNVWMVYIGRFITGYYAGIAWSCCPIYTAEISTKQHRGVLGVFYSALFSFGVEWTYLFGQWITWQWLIASYMLFNALMATGLLAIPESPRWLMMNGYKEAAIRSLEWFRQSDNVTEELTEIMDNIQNTELKFNLSEFKKREIFNPLLLAVGLCSFYLFSGIPLMDSYMVEILGNGSTRINVYYQATAVVLTLLITNIVLFVIIGRFRRRVLLIVSSAGLSLVCSGLAIYYRVKLIYPDFSEEYLYWFSLISICLYFIFFLSGWGPVSILVISEILPIKIRGLAGGVIVCLGWIISFLIVKTYVLIVENLGIMWVFIVYAIANLIGIFFTVFCLPETKDKTLEEIENHFRMKNTKL